MQLHQLKPRTTRYKYPRVGRGGKRGKTAGKGTKGQKARAGRKMRPELRDIIKKFPKLRGYRFKSINEKPSVINVGDLAIFSGGMEITPEILVEKKLIRRVHGRIPSVKILGVGELSSALKVSGCTVSTIAKGIIEKAGGTVHVPAPRRNPVPKEVKPVQEEKKEEKKAKSEKTKEEKKPKDAKTPKK